jgi:large subunit ribosomal protein L4
MIPLKIKFINFLKEEVGSKELQIQPASEGVSMDKSIAYVVRWQLAKRRSGSAKTKTMSEISGTTAKPHKQKGTGRARQGSKRSVQFVGGRTCHGPTPRSFDFSIPKKIVKKSLSSVLLTKLVENKVLLFSEFGDLVKTSKVKSFMVKNSLCSALVIHDKESVALRKSIKNLHSIKSLDSEALNVYDVIKYEYLIIEDKVFEKSILGAL